MSATPSPAPSGRSASAVAPAPSRSVTPTSLSVGAATPKRFRFLRWTLLTATIVGAVALGGRYYSRTNKTASATEQKGRGGRMVPVAVSPVKSGDLRVYLTALGAVTPLNTTTVRSRADGELIKLYFTEGQSVQAGDLLAEIDPRAYQVSLHQAEGQLARDTALLDNAKIDLERYQNAEAAVTKQQLANAQAVVAQYTGVVKSDQASVDNYQLQLSYCRILAPISGRVGLKMVDQGNLIRAAEATGIAVITQERPITVLFSLPEENVPALRKGLASGKPLRVQALDRSGKTVLSRGEVAALDNQIDAATGTVRLKALFKNEDDALFPNQFVNVRVLLEVQPNTLLVPTSAVQINGASRYVFVVDDAEQTVSRRIVTVGRTEGDQIAIESGLKENETVVVDGLDKLQDGMKVSARDSKAVSAPGENRPAGEGRGPGGDGRPKGERKKKAAAPTAP